ncbi:MAG: hypothetical protein IJA67_04455 [Oscillospiraceae bacterium]|nr:hypothetical protein [Oscillospiraceae bacterium]
MIRTNKDIFNSLVCKPLMNKLKLTSYLSEQYDVTEKYFLHRQSSEDPINGCCAECIKTMYENIVRIKSMISDKEDEEKTLKKCKQHYNNMIYMFKDDFYISNPTDEQVLEIVRIIVNEIYDKECIDLIHVLHKIKKWDSKICFTDEGKSLLKYIDPWLIEQESPELKHFVGRETELLRITQKMKKNNWVAITGEPGCGKYSLALQYAENHQNDYDLIYVLPWMDSLDETLAQIPTSDDDRYTCQTEDDNNKPETSEERQKRKRKTLLNSKESVLIIIYDAFRKLNPKEIKYICNGETSDINMIITTHHNHKNSVRLENDLSESDFEEIFFSIHTGASKEANRNLVNCCREISEGNIYRFIVLAEYLKKQKNITLAEALYYNFNEHNYCHFFADIETFVIGYHGAIMESTLYEHMERSFLIQNLSDEQIEQLYHAVLLLDDKMDAVCLAKLYDLPYDYYEKFSHFHLLDYTKKTNTLKYCKMLQITLLNKKMKLDYEVCNHLMYKYLSIDSSVSEKGHFAKMLFRCLAFQWGALSYEEECWHHIKANLFYYRNLLELFLFHNILPCHFLRNRTDNTKYNFFQDQKLQLFTAYVYGFLNHVDTYFRLCESKYSQDVSPILQNGIQYLCAFSTFYNYLFNPTCDHSRDNLMAAIRFIKNNALNTTAIAEERDVLFFEACLYYRDNKYTEFENALNNVAYEVETNQKFSLVYRIVMTLLYLDENDTFLETLYTKFSIYKNRCYECCAAISMLEFIVKRTIDIELLINLSKDSPDSEHLYLLPILALLEKKASSSPEKEQLLRFCSNNLAFNRYWTSLVGIDFGADITRAMKELEELSRLCRNVWGDDGTISPKIDKAIEIMDSLQSEAARLSPVHSIISDCMENNNRSTFQVPLQQEETSTS